MPKIDLIESEGTNRIPEEINKKSKKKMIIIVTTVLFLVAIGLLIYSFTKAAHTSDAPSKSDLSTSSKISPTPTPKSFSDTTFDTSKNSPDTLNPGLSELKPTPTPTPVVSVTPSPANPTPSILPHP